MTVNQIKDDLNKHLGKDVYIKYNLGRNKYEEYEVKIKELYNHIFLVELKDKALNTLKDYQVAYGNDTYGFVAYVLNIVRIYSIPLGFLGIVVAAIHRYVLGIRKLDTQEKGFGVMIGIITVMVICQVLPLIFAIVVRGWRG